MTGNENMTPSESEWLIMEVLWAGEVPMTSSAVIEKLQGQQDMTPKMIRVLMNRLCRKDMIGYTIDEKDARVYHYYALKSKEECLEKKSRKFAESYFAGNPSSALASLIQNTDLSEAQIEELEEILRKSKGKAGKRK